MISHRSFYSKLCRVELVRKMSVTRCNFEDWHTQFASWIKKIGLEDKPAFWVNGDETAIDLTLRDQYVWDNEPTFVQVPGL